MGLYYSRFQASAAWTFLAKGEFLCSGLSGLLFWCIFDPLFALTVFLLSALLCLVTCSCPFSCRGGVSFHTHTHTHTPPHTLPLPRSALLRLSDSQTLTLSHSYPHTHTLTPTLSLSPSLPHTLILSYSCNLSPSHSRTHFHNLALTHSHTHALVLARPRIPASSPSLSSLSPHSRSSLQQQGHLSQYPPIPLQLPHPSSRSRYSAAVKDPSELRPPLFLDHRLRPPCTTA